MMDAEHSAVRGSAKRTEGRGCTATGPWRMEVTAAPLWRVAKSREAGLGSPTPGLSEGR